MKETFDFSGVEPAKVSTYLKPGYYQLTPLEAKFVRPDGKKQNGDPKTPYMEVTFSGKQGIHVEKFYITTAAMDRIQTLHMSLYDKKLEKAFDSAEQIGAYFDKAFKTKAVTKMYLVGGEQADNGKVYSRLGYSGFVLPDDMNVNEGPFEEGSDIYRANVKMKQVNSSLVHQGVILPGEDVGDKKEDDYSLDLPF